MVADARLKLGQDPAPAMTCISRATGSRRMLACGEAECGQSQNKKEPAAK